MRHDESQRISMIRSERFAIVMSRQQDTITIKISERDIGCVSLLRMYEHVLCVRTWLNAREDLPHSNAGPAIIEAAPAGYTVEIAGALDTRELVEFFPSEVERMGDQSSNAEVPMCFVESGNGSIVQDRPLQRERLSGRQTSVPTHLLLSALALVTRKDS